MNTLKMVIPKGRLADKILILLEECGYGIISKGRNLKPLCCDPQIEVKIMKPQNIPYLLEIGSHDVGFTGWDWCAETGTYPLELMDLKFDCVRLVAAIPNNVKIEELRQKKIVAVSEYVNIANNYLRSNHFDYRLLRVFGATEVFPPDDADIIIDNTSSGSTLKDNNLKIIAEIMQSSTRFLARKKITADTFKMIKVEEMRLLFQSVLAARGKVMLEMNVPNDKADSIIPTLPAMESPTISKLYGDAGYAVKIVLEKQEAVKLIPFLKEQGVRDILEYRIDKVVI